MNPDINRASSRPLGVARLLRGSTINEAEIYSKVVVLTCEPSVVATQNGRWCFFDSLSLLSRVVGNLIVILPKDSAQLKVDLEEYCARAWWRGSLRVLYEEDQRVLETCDAILCIGTQARPSLAWTVINSNGWVARVSSSTESIPCDTDQPNAIGALMAASLGVTEVFKRVFDIPSDAAPLLGKTEFSLFDQTTSSPSLGPLLPDDISLPDTLQIGAGAIGNGIALLASQLPLQGRMHIVDNQDYAEENLGTCILLEHADWVGHPKAERLASWLLENSNLDVTGEKAFIEAAKSGTKMTELSIDLVLNGLDNIVARRDAQSLWPATIIDGGISEIGAAVVQHRLGHEELACLMCWFDEPKIDERLLQSQLTGLSISSLADTNRLLTEEDISLAARDKQPQLRERKKEGKTICSVMSEAALSTKFGIDVEDGFRPSVPFVATAAAAMVMAEAIKAILFPNAPVVAKFQIASLFLGPELSAQKLKLHPSSKCQCVVHRALINQLHTQRNK